MHGSSSSSVGVCLKLCSLYFPKHFDRGLGLTLISRRLRFGDRYSGFLFTLSCAYLTTCHAEHNHHGHVDMLITSILRTRSQKLVEELMFARRHGRRWLQQVVRRS